MRCRRARFLTLGWIAVGQVVIVIGIVAWHTLPTQHGSENGPEMAPFTTRPNQMNAGIIKHRPERDIVIMGDKQKFNQAKTAPPVTIKADTTTKPTAIPRKRVTHTPTTLKPGKSKTATTTRKSVTNKQKLTQRGERHDENKIKTPGKQTIPRDTRTKSVYIQRQHKYLETKLPKGNITIASVECHPTTFRDFFQIPCSGNGIFAEGANVAWYAAVVSLDSVDPRTTDLTRRLNKRLLKSNESCYGEGKRLYMNQLEEHAQHPALVLAHGQKLSKSSGVTLCLQFTSSRAHMLWDILKHWGGEVVVVVEVESPIFWQFYANFSGKLVPRVVAILVLKSHTYYAVNWMRNLAIKYSPTPWVMMMDVDFLPSANLWNKLTAISTSSRVAANDGKVAFVVPAFELYKNATDTKLPLDKKTLLGLGENGFVSQFHLSTLYGEPHGRTNYSMWKVADQLYGIPRGDCFGNYEPYIFVDKRVSPYLPETLLHRYRNKVTYFTELCRLRFDFYVLPDSFVIHRQHKPEVNRHLPDFKGCVDAAWFDFWEYLPIWLNKQKGFQ